MGLEYEKDSRCNTGHTRLHGFCLFLAKKIREGGRVEDKLGQLIAVIIEVKYLQQ